MPGARLPRGGLRAGEALGRAVQLLAVRSPGPASVREKTARKSSRARLEGLETRVTPFDAP